MQELLNRLAAALPHQETQPEYARWLQETYTPTAWTWHQENSLIHREPGLLVLPERFYKGRPEPFAPGTITASAPPYSPYPGGSQDDLPLHPRLLQRRIKKALAGLVLDPWQSHLQLAAPPPAPASADYDQQRRMFETARQIMLDSVPLPDPAALTRELRALYDPELLAAAEAILGRRLRLRHLRLMAERRELLTAAFQLHPYGLLLGLGSYPSMPHGLHPYWERLNPHGNQQEDSRYLQTWQLAATEQTPEQFLENIRQRHWHNPYTVTPHETNLAAWEWTKSLPLAVCQQETFPTPERLFKLHRLFPDRPPPAELLTLLLQQQAGKLLDLPSGKPERGGLAGWLTLLAQQLRAAPEQAAALLKTLRLTVMALQNTQELAESLRQQIREAGSRLDPEILEAALRQALAAAGAAQSTAPSRGICQARRQEQDVIQRLAQRMTTPVLAKALQEELQPRLPKTAPKTKAGNAAPAISARFQEPVGFLGRPEQPLLRLYRRSLGGAERLNLLGPGLSDSVSELIPLAWAHPQFLEQQRYMAYGEFSRLRELLLHAAVQLLERQEAKDRQRRQRRSATAAPPPSAAAKAADPEPTRRQYQQAAERWLNALSLDAKEKLYRQAAAAVGALLAQHADPAILAALYKLLPPTAFTSLRLCHYNQAAPTAPAFPEIAAWHPAVALWWLTGRSVPAAWKKDSPRSPRARMESIVKSQLRREGGLHWEAFQSLPRDLICHPASPTDGLTSQSDRQTAALRRRLVSLSSLLASAGTAGLPPDPWTAHDLAHDYERQTTELPRRRLRELTPILSRQQRENPAWQAKDANATPASLRIALVKRFVAAPDGLASHETLLHRTWAALEHAAAAWQQKTQKHVIAQEMQAARALYAGAPLPAWDSRLPQWESPEGGWTAQAITDYAGVTAAALRLAIHLSRETLPVEAQEDRCRLFLLTNQANPPERAVATLTRKEDGGYALNRLQAEQNSPPSLSLQEAARQLAADYQAAENAATAAPKGKDVPAAAAAPLLEPKQA